MTKIILGFNLFMMAGMAAQYHKTGLEQYSNIVGLQLLLCAALFYFVLEDYFEELGMD